MIASKNESRSPSTRSRRHAARLLVLVGVLVGLFGLLTPAAGAFEPSKWLLSSTIGHDVNKTKTESGAPQEERNQCTVASPDQCQFGEEATDPRGFSYAKSVAVNATNGDVYVADDANQRVQVLTESREFLFMFGWNVNLTKVALGNGASQQEKNVCTAASHNQCETGERGTGLAEQLGEGLGGVAVDSVTGRVYVLERQYHRVQEFTETGEFVLMFGGGVNKQGGNVCTKSEVSECQAGKEGTANGEFDNLEPQGNTITVGPEGLVYVGDQGRVQRFEADGAPVGAPLSAAGLSSTGPVENVAVDGTGDVFVSVGGVTGVHEYSSSGALQSCVIDGAAEYIKGVAFDTFGRIAVSSFVSGTPHVALYQTQGKCGETVGGEITPPSGTVEGLPSGLAFSLSPAEEDQLYIANSGAQRVESYTPVRFPEVRTCATGAIMFTTALLCGEVNANTLVTRGFFKYGTGEERVLETPTAFSGAGGTFEPMMFEVTGLTPNESYSDEAWVEAENQGKLTTAGNPPPVSFRTKAPPPEVPGAPTASFITAQSAVLGASVNPEHAMTSYHFEYAQCESESEAFAACSEPRSAVDLSSGVYGVVGVTQEISGLTPSTVYAYRLVADNSFEIEGRQEGGRTVGADEGHLTTTALPVPSASTGGVGAVTATSAIVTGTVNPDGPAATYVFELGVYVGAGTQYGIVSSGPVGASLQPEEEQLALSGLQPGTTYAYRITIESGYGQSIGATATFTTAGLPSVLVVPPVLAQLPILNIAFPKGPAKVTPRKLTRAQKLTRALKACAKKPKSKRAACRRAAHKRYAIGGKARKSAW